MPRQVGRIIQKEIQTQEGLIIRLKQEEGRAVTGVVVRDIAIRMMPLGEDVKQMILNREIMNHNDLFLEARREEEARLVRPKRRAAGLDPQPFFHPAQQPQDFVEDERDRIERLEHQAINEHEILRDEVLHKVPNPRRGVKMEDVLQEPVGPEPLNWAPAKKQVVKKAAPKEKKVKKEKAGVFNFRGYEFPRPLTYAEMSYLDNLGYNKLLRVLPELAMDYAVQEEKINEDEELIINFVELADHYAMEECERTIPDFKIDTHEMEYQAAYKKHLNNIIKFKKINNG